MGELSHQRGGGKTSEADRTCRPGNEGKAAPGTAHLMQKRALIAMQYSALHNRTWITPTVQKPCSHGLQNKKAMKSFDFTAFSGAAEVGLYEQISRLNNHRPFRLPPMRATTLNFFGTLSGSYELRFRLRQSRCLDSHCPAPAGFPRCYGSR